MSKKIEINENSVFVGGLEYVPKNEAQNTPQPEGDYVIVRCRNAGVHAGYLKEQNANTLILENSRRLWRWWSKFSLSGLAMCGVLQSRKNEVKFACVLPKITLIMTDVCEIIPCTKEARESIQSIPEHIND